MPGSIRVSVLEAFDLPDTIADGEDVAIKVAVGTREYQTAANKAVGGKTAQWSLDFTFPVLNLRDNLLVTLLDVNGEAISKSEIDTPSIVEQGSFDVNLLLNGGGNVHLDLSFVLTEEERRRIDVMRAAALKRREQEALRSSVDTQLVPVKGEVEMKSSEHHTTPAESLKKDNEKNFSATTSQESDPSQFEPILPAAHEESLTCVDSTGNLDTKSPEESQTNVSGAVEGASEQLITPSVCGVTKNEFSSLDNGNQEPTKIADLAVNDNSIQAATDQMAAQKFNFPDSVTIKETKSEDESDIPQPDPEENEELVEDTNLKPTSSSVKAKIKAFEKAKPQAATKLNHILSPTSKIQKFSPYSKTSAIKNFEGDVEHVAKTENEALEPANQMEAAESNKDVLMGNMAAVETSEEEHLSKEEKCLFEVPTMKRSENDGLQYVSSMDYVESIGRNFEEKQTSLVSQKGSLSDEPAPRMDTTGIQGGNLKCQATEAEQPKCDEIKSSSMQEGRKIDLLGLSKQVLSGAVSGFIVIAVGALLWAANPKRRYLSKENGNNRQHLRTFSSLDPRASASTARDFQMFKPLKHAHV